MSLAAPKPAVRQRIEAELDQQRRNGPLREIRIPPCPERLTQLHKALSQAEPDLAAIARIASGDVAMSAVLIRLANSARYGTGHPVPGVGQAMNRLGLNATAAAMSEFIVRQALKVDHPQLRRFWERSALRAEAMVVIARRVAGLDLDTAHTHGLFSHVGMPVLLQSVRGYGATLVEAAARIDRSFIATENANHRTDHAVVGALVARVWQLGGTVMAAIRLHHDLETIGSREVEPEVQTLVAAGLMADHLMRRQEGLPPEPDWVDRGAQALDWLAFSESDLEDCERELALGEAIA